MTKYIFLLFLLCFVAACKSGNANRSNNKKTDSLVYVTYSDPAYKTIHVIVALCDNKYQGIVPVPKAIGNGQDPNSNLYWGNNYGLRAFFKNSHDWKLIKKAKVDKIRLERLVFKHVSQNYYLVADAYDGKYIRNATKDFLYSCSGQMKDTIHINKTIVGINGNSKLLAYIGHNGLMDFHLSELIANRDGQKRDCIILACISKKYFDLAIREANANPILWTNQLMCPEAYTLHDAIAGYINNESPDFIRSRAIKAYSKYQKCSNKEAGGILVAGW